MTEKILYRYTKLYLETDFLDYNSVNTYYRELETLTGEELSKCEEFRDYIIEKYPEWIWREWLIREAREYLSK